MSLETIWQTIVTICQSHPEILIFLSLAIGYFIGKIKFFGFTLGSTTSTLLTALVLGQINIKITPLIQMFAFSLFIFVIGYQIGPKFLNSLKKNGINYFILTIFFAIVGLATAIILGKLFGFDKGTTAGLLSGSLTQSSIIGTARDAIENLSIASSQKALLLSNITIAHAVTYIFGFAGVIVFYKLLPRFLKIDLKKEAQKLKTNLQKKSTQKTKIIKNKTKETYIVMIGIGCVLGTLLGLATIKIGTAPLTLGITGGVLLSGLFFGWLNSTYQTFAHIPEESQWLLTSLGLNVFIACVGLSAGPRTIEVLKTQGPSLFFAGVILALVPHILGIAFGRIVLKLNYILLLGALTGAGTITPSLQVLKDESESATPALGYTLPYALSNFILTLLGAIVVYFM